MSYRDAIGEYAQGPKPKWNKIASEDPELDFIKLADLMDKQASIIDGGESQDAATQQVLSAIMDDGMTGEKARKVELIRNRLQDRGVTQ